MSQLSFGDMEYAGKKKRTRREVFLAEMEQVVSWQGLLGLMSRRIRRPVGVVRRTGRKRCCVCILMQNWFGFSDPAMKEALYEIAPVRQFAQLSLARSIQDETTILNFRHLLEAHDLAVGETGLLHGTSSDQVRENSTSDVRAVCITQPMT
jgi:IS5 family transposase